MSEEPLVARDATYYRAPEALRERLRASLAGAAREERRAYGWRVLGIGIAAAAAASITWSVALVTLAPGEPERIGEQVVTAHVRSLMAPNHLVDVTSADSHTVKPWFAGKLPFAPPVADYSQQGFELTGGRLDYIEGQPAAAITYRHRLHTVNLFVWPAKSAGERTSAEDGFELAEWSDGGLRFAAVSDIPPPELRQFERAFRSKAAASGR